MGFVLLFLLMLYTITKAVCVYSSFIFNLKV